jgi:GntR family transcriptional regulator, transcriptional repressor for pyruvate dehydrogenase complex
MDHNMRSRSRTEQLAEALRARIGRGLFPVGSKLPSEQALAASFQVSRTVVREAVTRLKADGLVETRKGTAARVRAVSAMQDGALSMPRSIDGLLGFLEVRRSIEAEMAALAAERRTELQCEEIHEALLAISRSTDEANPGVEEDLHFHLSIGRATSNAYWNQFVRLFTQPMRAAIRLTRANEARRRDFAADVAVEHRLIYDAIHCQKPDEARAAAHRHLENAATRVLLADRDFWQHEGRLLADNWATQDRFEPEGPAAKLGE